MGAHKSLNAFDWAIYQGWEEVEANVTRNPFFPKNFSFDAHHYFKDFAEGHHADDNLEAAKQNTAKLDL